MDPGGDPGPTTVRAFFEGAEEGDASDDDGDTREEVTSDVASMELVGNSSLGPITLRLDPSIPSLGEIEETLDLEPGQLDLPPFGRLPPYDDANNATGLFLEVRSIVLDSGEGGDEDGPSDLRDNCIEAPNPSQLDTDEDGFGNACDCDFDNGGFCNIGDFSIFLADFLPGIPGPTGTDMNGDGFVSIDDFTEFLVGFLSGRPGPSAFAP